jgi:hypothetical protein
MPGGGRGPTKYDVEMQRLNRRYDLFERLLPIGGLVLSIIASALPIFVFLDELQPFAGKTTSVSFNAALSITAALSVAVNMGQFINASNRKRSIKRLRKRTDELEALGLQGSGGAGISRSQSRGNG